MSSFTENDLQYLQRERRLARIAAVGADGTPHLAPVDAITATVMPASALGPAILSRVGRSR